MHVVTNRRQGVNREYVTHLLRRSYREGGKVKNETVGNISHLPDEAVELVRRSLAGEVFFSAEEDFEIERSLPAGHVEAALSAARSLGLAQLIDRRSSRERSLVMAMVIQRVLGADSKLGISRCLMQSSLGGELGVEGATEDDLYRALDWLVKRQEKIESRLARRHLEDGSLVLYDLSSSYFEGRKCELAGYGYSRDERRGSLQIVYGLMCDREGRPVAIEVFEGGLKDSQSVPAQITKLKERFGLDRVVLVSDRGMVTRANIDLLARTEGIEWVTALKAPQVKRLLKEGDLQLSLMDEQNLAEITSEDFPAERLVVCRNPLVAEERARKREELLQATESLLSAIAARVKAKTLTGEDRIGMAVGEVVNRHRMKKHLVIEITDTSFEFHRKEDEIHQEALLDGIYVLRTSVSDGELTGPEVLETYKGLARVERAFKNFKGPLEIRPIHHHLNHRVKAHVFCCMLSYYLEWHLREAWSELCFKDEEPPRPEDPVAKAARSEGALAKAHTKKTADGHTAHSFQSLIGELSTLTENTVSIPGTGASFQKRAKPTPLQAKALELAKLG